MIRLYSQSQGVSHHKGQKGGQGLQEDPQHQFQENHRLEPARQILRVGRLFLHLAP